MYEHEKRVVKNWIDTCIGGEKAVLGSISDHFHEDATWTLIGNTPMSGTHRGLDAILNDFILRGRRGDGRPGPSVQGLSSEYGVKIYVDEMLALEDGRVAVFCRSDASGRNGVPYKNQYCWVLTVRGDKIAAMVEFCDTTAIERSHFDKKLVPAGTTQAVYAT